MKTVAVIYHSETGTTAQLAQAIIAGIHNVGQTTATEYRLSSTHVADGRLVDEGMLSALDHVDAMIFGSPTLMGGVSAVFKAFADASGTAQWAEQRWRNKLAAGFTVGANLNADQSTVIHYLQTFACQHGMLWTGLDLPAGTQQLNRLGSQSGLIAQSADGILHPTDKKTAVYLGKRLATLTQCFYHDKQVALR